MLSDSFGNWIWLSDLNWIHHDRYNHWYSVFLSLFIFVSDFTIKIPTRICTQRCLKEGHHHCSDNLKNPRVWLLWHVSMENELTMFLIWHIHSFIPYSCFFLLYSAWRTVSIISIPSVQSKYPVSTWISQYHKIITLSSTQHTPLLIVTSICLSSFLILWPHVCACVYVRVRVVWEPHLTIVTIPHWHIILSLTFLLLCAFIFHLSSRLSTTPICTVLWHCVLWCVLCAVVYSGTDGWVIQITGMPWLLHVHT